MDIVLGFVFLLCLLLLIMIFGEQLSILGAFHGRWISALAESFADLCDFLWDEIDRAWSFVTEHVWWVLAVGSGSSGGLIVAWMIFGGVADQATADLAGRTGQLHAGGILDQVPEIDTQLQVQRASFTRTEEPIARRTWQVPSPHAPAFDHGLAGEPDLRFDDSNDSELPPWPELRRDIDEPNFGEWIYPASDSGEFGPLLPEERFRPRRSLQPQSPWVTEIDDAATGPDDDRVSVVHGTTVVSGSLKREIEYALSELRFNRTRWRQFDQFSGGRRGSDEFSSITPAMDEATADELSDVESAVRVVSGTGIAESDLNVQKQVLPTSDPDQFDIEIQVTNESRRRMSGLLVREQLPYRVEPVSVDDDGVYRQDTVTWVIADLPPRRTQVVRARVRSDSTDSFVTHTEISAVAAVSSEVFVEPDRRPERPRREPPRREPPRREPPPRETPRGQPDVQMTMGDVPESAKVSEKLAIPFELRNRGTAVAEEILLRVVLPMGLDHFHLDENDLERSISVNVRNLEPGQTKTVMLRVRATDPGEQEAFVQLLVNRREQRLGGFTVNVREEDRSDLQPLLPEPDFSVPPRSR